MNSPLRHIGHDADGMAVYRDDDWTPEPVWTIPTPPVALEGAAS